MENLAKLIKRFPLLFFLSIVGITIYAALGMTKLVTRNNTDNELPKDDSIIVTNKKLEKIFGNKDIVLIGIETPNVFDSSLIEKVIKISDELKAIKYIISTQVTSLSTVDNIESTDWGLQVDPYFKEIPVTDTEMVQIIEKVTKNKLINGRLLSKDHTFTAIIANLEEGYNQGFVYRQLVELTQKYEDTNTKFFLAGDAVQQEEIDMGIQKDIGILLPLSIALLLLGLFLVFRTFNGVWIPFIVVILSIIWTMGFMGHFDFPITVVSSAIPVLMIAAASSYGIHLMERFYSELYETKDKDLAIKRVIINVSPAVFMAGFTSALGSITLLTFHINSIKEFGIIGCVGMLSALIIAILFVPSTLLLLKKLRYKEGDMKKKAARHTKENPFLRWIANFLIKQKVAVITITVILSIVAIYGATKIKVGNDFIKYFPEDHVLRVTFDKFNDKLSGARYMDVMFEGATEEAIKEPEFLRELDSLQNYINKLNGVGSTYSFVDIIKRINKEMHEGDSTFEKVPETKELIAQYLLLYSMSGGPDDFSDVIDYEYKRAKIRIMLLTSEQDDHINIYKNIKNYASTHINKKYNVDFGGEAIFWVAFVRYLVLGKIQNIIGAVIIVLLFCMIAFRSVTIGILGIIPVLLSIISTFGLMGFLGIRLEMGTAIITSMATGIGIDFACHFINRLREESSKTSNINDAIYTTLQTSGKAIIYGAISTILGFMVFIFSGFTPLQAFGWLISFTMVTVTFATLVLLPVIFGNERLKIASKLNRVTKQKML